MPIHYVGAQCHDDLSFYSDFPGYIDSVKRYSRSVVELGVQWHFTEITVGLDEAGGDFMTEEEQTTQANPTKPPHTQRAILSVLASSIHDDV